MSSLAHKILVCGDVRGQFKTLFNRINQVNRKSGSFDLILCVGEFFGVDCDMEYNDLIYGSLVLPSIPIYILGTTDTTLIKYYKSQDSNSDYDSGFELIEGITFLGRKGILTSSSGLRIAYLSGKETNDKSNDDKTTFDIKDYESLVLSDQSSSAVIDILLTSQWPKHIFRYTDEHPKQLENRCEELGSELVSKLCHILRPRYHFVGGLNCFYERHPFRNHKVLAESCRAVTRFIGLAEVGNPSKEKWLYAFGMTAAKLMDKNELIKQPIDVTENPFIDLTEEKFSENTKKSSDTPQFFYDLNQTNESNQMNQNFHNKRKRYQNNDFKDKKRSVDQSQCWFCLASPHVEKHLIISVGDHSYLAMAKGGLTEEHLLILPIDHLRSTIELEDHNISNELNKFKEVLIQYFKSKQQSVVFFERNFKSSHLQIQVVPIPENMGHNLKSIILDLTEQRNLKFKELSNDLELKDVLNAGIPYFYIELPNAKLFTRINKNEFFPIQLGRELLADPQILNCLDRIDWKQCCLSEERVTSLANQIRKDFESFDFTLS